MIKNKLSYYRKQNKIRQIDLAAKLDVSNKTMVTWEKEDFDLKQLSLIKLEEICDVLSIKVSDLVGEIN